MVTKTLLCGGERGPLVTVNGQQGSWFRSYDKATGEIVSETLLPANTTGVPMTYMVNNKQYIVVAVAAAGRPAELDRADAAVSNTKGRVNALTRPVDSRSLDS